MLSAYRYLCITLHTETAMVFSEAELGIYSLHEIYQIKLFNCFVFLFDYFYLVILFGWSHLKYSSYVEDSFSLSVKNGFENMRPADLVLCMSSPVSD